MTALGWTFLTLSLGFVVGLCVWCYHRVLTAPSEIERPPDLLGG